jgi:hypothetical protein
MITINLLPHHLRPIKRTPLPYVLSGLVFLAVLVGCVMIFANMQGRIFALNHQLQEQQTEMASLQPVVEEFNRLNASKATLRNKIQAISDIVGDRIIWSQHLAKLAQLVPKNLWYDEIKVELKPFTEYTKELDPRTKEMVEKKIVVKRPVLVVSGYAIEDEDGNRSVNPLTSATQTDTQFATVFDFLSPAIEDTEFDGYQVRAFSLEYLIRPGGTVND